MRCCHHCTITVLIAIGVVVVGAFAQEDTSRGYVGSELCFRKLLTVERDSCTLRVTLRLSNPTVWYPMHIRIGGELAQLYRVNDTLWHIDMPIVHSSTVEMEACGTVLAGSDSVCIVTLDSLVGCVVEPTTIRHVLIIKSVGPPLPYVRFATMEGPFPLPLDRHQPFFVYIRVDARSRVLLRLYDLVGRELLRWSEDLERGTHRVELLLPVGTAPGVYVLTMESTTGYDRRVVVAE